MRYLIQTWHEYHRAPIYYPSVRSDTNAVLSFASIGNGNTTDPLRIRTRENLTLRKVHMAVVSTQRAARQHNQIRSLMLYP